MNDWKPDGDYDRDWPDLSDRAVRRLKPDTVGARLDDVARRLGAPDADDALAPTGFVGGAAAPLATVVENHLLLLLACLDPETGWPHEGGWPRVSAAAGNVAPFGKVAARRLRDRELLRVQTLVSEDDSYSPHGSGYLPTGTGGKAADALAAMVDHDLRNDDPEPVYRYASWKLDRAVMEIMGRVWDRLHFTGGCGGCQRWTATEMAHALNMPPPYAAAALKALVARGVVSRRPVVNCRRGPPRMHTYALGRADHRDAQPKLLTLGGTT